VSHIGRLTFSFFAYQTDASTLPEIHFRRSERFWAPHICQEGLMFAVVWPLCLQCFLHWSREAPRAALLRVQGTYSCSSGKCYHKTFYLKLLRSVPLGEYSFPVLLQQGDTVTSSYIVGVVLILIRNLSIRRHMCICIWSLRTTPDVGDRLSFPHAIFPGCL
jgi:hypothetical protein